MTSTNPTTVRVALDGPESFPVVTICGSMRFYAFMLDSAKQLTREGLIVLMPHDATLTGLPAKTDTEAGRMLDAMHRAKIRMSGSIYVVNLGGYIGPSTRSEIEYATGLGIPIEYAVPPTPPDSEPAHERELLFVNGPLAGETRRRNSALPIPTDFFPLPSGELLEVHYGPGVFAGRRLAEDTTIGRYVPHPERPHGAEPIWLLWVPGLEPQENVPQPYDPGDYCGSRGVTWSRHGEDCRAGDLL